MGVTTALKETVVYGLIGIWAVISFLFFALVPMPPAFYPSVMIHRPVNQRLVKLLLEKRRHQVVVAGNGREALTAMEKGTFDLVLMDVQMPEMDGLEATAAIRAVEMDSGKHQMVIALTAHAMKGDQERCLAAGMEGYLSKPIRPQELDLVLENIAKRRNAAEKVDTTVVSPIDSRHL